MNYTDVTDTALGYTDRADDTDVLANIDNMLRLVESKINRRLRTMKMVVDEDIAVVPDQTLYALPSGFRGLRLAKHVDGDRETPMRLITPEQYANEKDVMYESYPLDSNVRREILYFIDDEFIYLWRAQDAGNINLLYYLEVPELTAVAATNWVSNDYPDCYTKGLIAEIYAFEEDEASEASWASKFEMALAEIKVEDKHDRWSGAPMQMRTE